MIQQTTKPANLTIETLKKMLSKDKETPFSSALWDIIHDPQIPNEQPKESEISSREYQQAKAIWDLVRNPAVTSLSNSEKIALDSYDRAKSIWDRNKGQSRRKSRIKLSLDDFQAMLIDLYGFEIINRSATHRLIHTANINGVQKPAKNINKGGLAVIANFVPRVDKDRGVHIFDDYPLDVYPTSFDVLLAIGEKTILDVYGDGDGDGDGDNREDDDEAESLDAASSYSDIKNIRSSLLLDHQGNLTEDSPNNLRTLIHHFLVENANSDLGLDGNTAIALIDLLFKAHPKVDLQSLLKIQVMLGIPANDFLEMLRRDIENMN